jgi:hypothetical protein
VLVTPLRVFLCCLAGAALSAGCRPNVQVAVLPDGPPAERAAVSFVHCVESSTSSCIQTGTFSVGWDAFAMLAWLVDGSPVAIVESLPAELAVHQDDRLVQQRFVSEVERYAVSIRGAQCQAVETHELRPLIDRAGQLAAARIEELGLWQRNVDRVIGMLVDEAHRELDTGSLVRMDCDFDPFHLFVAMRESDGQYAAVGLTTILPPTLGGATPGRKMVETRLRSRALGLDTAQAPIVTGDVNPWLPFPVEVF